MGNLVQIVIELVRGAFGLTTLLIAGLTSDPSFPNWQVWLGGEVFGVCFAMRINFNPVDREIG